MKTINVIKAVLLFTVLYIGTSLAVTAGNPDQAPAASIRTNIVDNLKMPDRDILTDAEGVVDVLFRVDEGKICIEKVTSGNAELAKYVKTELGKICCKNSKAVSNSHFSLRITFKLL